LIFNIKGKSPVALIATGHYTK